MKAKTSGTQTEPLEGNVEVMAPEGRLFIVGPISLLKKVLEALERMKGGASCEG